MPPTPQELATALDAALDARLPSVALYDGYYLGVNKVAFATSKWRETFGNLFKELSDNWAQLVVDASVERLKVEGFRFGPAGDEADAEAWALWQANYLDADSGLAHTEACKTGIAYLLVTPTDDPETPRISVEHPAQVIVQHAPDDRRRRLAAFKRWRLGEDTLAMLYTPEAFVPLVKPGTAEGSNSDAWRAAGEPVANEIGIVPVVPMLNNPTILGEGLSDLNVVVPLQDAVNKLLADLLVNSEYVAYPQRYVTGLEIPIDPATGRPYTDREHFLSSVSRMWLAEDEKVKFGQLPESDGNGYVAQIEMLIQHVAAQTRTPPHYLLGSSGSFPSGESLKATETGLVAKVKRKQVSFGEAWEEAMRLAFLYRGDTERGAAANAETIWADPESRSEGELVDALTKMRTLGVPLEALWERWGASPQQIERWKNLIGLPERSTGPPPGPPGTPTATEELPPATSGTTTGG
jgi:Phage portal protein, SPP1 Gp6-like